MGEPLIIRLDEVRDRLVAKNLQPYYLDLCDQVRIKRVALFRCIGKGIDPARLERMRIEIEVIDRKISEVAKIMKGKGNG